MLHEAENRSWTTRHEAGIETESGLNETDSCDRFMRRKGLGTCKTDRGLAGKLIRCHVMAGKPETAATGFFSPVPKGLNSTLKSFGWVKFVRMAI